MSYHDSMTTSLTLYHCDWKFIFVYNTTVFVVNMSSRFSSKSEAFASELLENIEEMFPHYLY